MAFLQTVSRSLKTNISVNRFFNVVQLENGKWYKNNHWIFHLVIWPLLTTGLILYVFILDLSSEFVMSSLDTFGTFLNAFTFNKSSQADIYVAISMFFGLSMLVIQIGIIVLLQNTIVSEIENGSLLWLMSNPVSRTEIIVAKFVSNLINLTIYANIIPILTLISLIYFKTGILIPIHLFIVPFFLIFLLSAFYVSLLLLLGVLFETRALVLFFSLVITQISGIVAFVKPLYDFIISVFPLSFGIQSELYVFTGKLSSISPILWTLVLSILFLLFTVKLFQKKQF